MKNCLVHARLSCQVHVYVLYAKARYVYPVRTVRPPCAVPGSLDARSLLLWLSVVGRMVVHGPRKVPLLSLGWSAESSSYTCDRVFTCLLPRTFPDCDTVTD